MALVTGEIYCRIFYIKPWTLRLIEEQIKNDWSSQIRRNSLGLRDQEHTAIKPPNTQRVLILGDSFTFGVGVADPSKIFPEILEQRFQLEGGEKKVEILNGGIPGSLTKRWVKLLLEIKDSFQPDVILIVFFLRDGTLTGSIGDFFTPIGKEMENRNKDSTLYYYSYLYRKIKDVQDRLELSQKYSKKIKISYLGNAEETREWENAKKNILKIKKIGDSIQAKVAFVVFPILIELNDNYPFQEICDVLTQFTNEHQIQNHSLLPAFMGEVGPNLWVSPNDQHPNPKGHKIAADSIFPFLKELLDFS